jgi:sugar/nucleoside kinase (ribokinase family)
VAWWKTSYDAETYTSLLYLIAGFHGAVPSFKVQQFDTTGVDDAFVGAMFRRIVKDPSSLQISHLKFVY